MNNKNGCGCRCGGSEMLSIPKGNDFRVHICGDDVVPGQANVSFGDVENLKAYIVSWLGRRDEVSHELKGSVTDSFVDEEASLGGGNTVILKPTDGVGQITAFYEPPSYMFPGVTRKYTDIEITVPAALQRLTVYGIEITGTYGGHQWRWKARDVFRIVDSNCEASMNGNETLGMETYYLKDVLEVWTEDDIMFFISHGHVSLQDRTLTVQDNDDMEVTLDGDTVVFQER